MLKLNCHLGFSKTVVGTMHVHEIPMKRIVYDGSFVFYVCILLDCISCCVMRPASERRLSPDQFTQDGCSSHITL